MTISYNLGIPAAANDPSVDQPDMLENNDAIPAILAIDHVTFNNAGSGQHKQVTFPSNNVPTLPTNPPVLFTNNDAFSIPQLFFYTGTAAQSANQYTLPSGIFGSAGSVLLPGGLIMKWGLATGVATGGGTAFTYAGFGLAPFPHTTFNIQATVFSASSQVNVVTATSSGFTLSINGSGGNIFWLAIGN